MEAPIFSLVVSVDIAISALQQQLVSRDVWQPGHDPLHKITLVLDVINQMFYFSISCKSEHSYLYSCHNVTFEGNIVSYE
jgi:hypothetical protein